jgi:hypothetical protein
VSVPYPPPLKATVERWSEAGRRSRKWYWQVQRPNGEVVCAGIQPTKEAAELRAGDEARLQRNIDYQCSQAAAWEAGDLEAYQP